MVSETAASGTVKRSVLVTASEAVLMRAGWTGTAARIVRTVTASGERGMGKQGTTTTQRRTRRTETYGIKKQQTVRCWQRKWSGQQRTMVQRRRHQPTIPTELARKRVQVSIQHRTAAHLWEPVSACVLCVVRRSLQFATTTTTMTTRMKVRQQQQRH